MDDSDFWLYCIEKLYYGKSLTDLTKRLSTVDSPHP